MWQFAVWGAVGAMANVGVVFIEATRRVKGPPWARPHGPGGGMYSLAVLANLLVAAGATGALAEGAIVTNSTIAFAIGAAAPAVVKKLATYAETMLPASDNETGSGG
ncbi:MAG: hypothetical protein M3422_25070 [Actinomycetota bacterium]|nr:hypothetical protein [Actinomycetota bacterium]